jgi:hypothetical protein
MAAEDIPLWSAPGHWDQLAATNARPQDNGLSAAPLMMAFPVVLAIAAVVGLLRPAGARRALVLTFLDGAALALLLGQMALGFPLHEWYAHELAPYAARPATAGKIDVMGELARGVEVRYTGWLWLALAVTAAAALLSGLEWAAFRRGGPPGDNSPRG